jgi:hypothetical protein
MKKRVDRELAYKKSLELLHKVSSENGFLASVQSKANYKRIWARDSMVCSLAGLLSNDPKLIGQVKKSLNTLAKFQYKHGQIPSNVDVKAKNVSYGGTAGRIDANLWFIVTFGQYVKRTNDLKTLRKLYKNVKQAFELSHLYEFNEKGFIYVPKGGDWADEYVQEGYVLYDQVLYYQAMREFLYLRNRMNKSTSELVKKVEILRQKILVNFMLDQKNRSSKYIYHKTLFDKHLKKKKYRTKYLLAYFNPSEYGWRFDGFGNSIALNLNILPDSKKEKLFVYMEQNFSGKENWLVPAFYPAITSKDYEWPELVNSHQFGFRNKPGEYQNGGLWPVITGFYVGALAKKNLALAEKHLDGINYANSLGGWSFREFVSARTLKGGGTKQQAWSAAAGVIAYHTALKGEKLFL